MPKEAADKTTSSGQGGRKRRSAGSRRARKANGNGNGYAAAALETGMREGKSLATKAYEWADEMGRSMPRMARDFRANQMSGLKVLTEANPLVLGAIGLGIGVALGTLLPHAGLTEVKSSPSTGRRRAGNRRSKS
jgi:hypothetical protein